MMRSGSTNAFEIDKNKVIEEISKTGQFQSENIFIKKWENDQDTEGYLSHLTKIILHSSAPSMSLSRGRGME
jgi:hypothetical protein